MWSISCHFALFAGVALWSALYAPIQLGDPTGSPGGAVAVRVRGEPGAFASSAREVVARLDPGLPLYWVRTMAETTLHMTAERIVHRADRDVKIDGERIRLG